jgi:hypothetical protein
MSAMAEKVKTIAIGNEVPMGGIGGPGMPGMTIFGA